MTADTQTLPLFVCHGCGAVVDPARAFPFACPDARAGDDVDHVLVAPGPGQDGTGSRQRTLTPRPSAASLSLRERGSPSPSGGRWPEGPDEGPPRHANPDFADAADENPLLRYRRWLSPYRLARAAKLSDAAWTECVGALDARLQALDGRGFRRTPFVRAPALAAALGIAGPLWLKDETRNVSGSHKARHLMGAMLYLRVLEISGLPLGEGLRARRLAIASCGNAALAAAVIARAADWPLDVFIPPDAEPAVVRRLKDLGATVVVCQRRPGEAGDPCRSEASCRERVCQYV